MVVQEPRNYYYTHTVFGGRADPPIPPHIAFRSACCLLILKATPSATHPCWFLGLPFRALGASFLTIWEIILAPQGAPWGAIFPFQGHSGGPWEQQDDREAVNNWILRVLGVALGFVVHVKLLLLDFKMRKIILFSGLFPDHLFIDF